MSEESQPKNSYKDDVFCLMFGDYDTETPTPKIRKLELLLKYHKKIQPWKDLQKDFEFRDLVDFVWRQGLALMWDEIDAVRLSAEGVMDAAYNAGFHGNSEIFVKDAFMIVSNMFVLKNNMKLPCPRLPGLIPDPNIPGLIISPRWMDAYNAA